MSPKYREIIVDLALRLLSCVCVGIFALSAIGAYAEDRTRITLAVAVVSEISTIVISLISRRPVARDWQPLTVAATVYGGALFAPLVSVAPGYGLLNETASAAIQCIGIVWPLTRSSRSGALSAGSRPTGELSPPEFTASCAIRSISDI